MRARAISVNFRAGGSEFAFFAALFRFFSQDFFLSIQKINSDFCLSILSPVSTLKPLAGRDGVNVNKM
jgi:hypothetical protein